MIEWRKSQVLKSATIISVDVLIIKLVRKYTYKEHMRTRNAMKMLCHELSLS